MNCLADPCDVNFCPAHPDAKCVSDFCGGCNAQFFGPGGEVEVTDTCNCPDLVNCFIDPCQFATCPAFPNASCLSDYCGGCNARFFDKDGIEVTDICDVVNTKLLHYREFPNQDP